METFSVNQLAKLTQETGEELGYKVQIKNIKNPRVEQEEHYYNPSYQGLIELGIKPNYLTKQSMKEMFEIVAEYKERIAINTFQIGIKW